MIAIVIFVILLVMGQAIASVALLGILAEAYTTPVSGMLGIALGALGVIGWNKWNSFP